jgi:hypothetical protein
MTRARILLGSTNHIGCDVDIIFAVFPGCFACGVSRYNIGVNLKRKNLKKGSFKILKNDLPSARYETNFHRWSVFPIP